MLGAFNLSDALIVCPGDPNRSVLYYRMAKTGSGHMPHLGSNVIDDRGLASMASWIASLPAADAPPPSEKTAAAMAEQDASIKSVQANRGGVLASNEIKH